MWILQISKNNYFIIVTFNPMTKKITVNILVYIISIFLSFYTYTHLHGQLSLSFSVIVCARLSPKVATINSFPPCTAGLPTHCILEQRWVCPPEPTVCILSNSAFWDILLIA